MRKLLTALSTIVIALFCNALQAEIYKDFVPFITLKQVKLNYPNAKFEDLKPAWANEDEVMITMSGEGLNGEIVLKFSKDDKRRAKRLAENEAKSLNDNSKVLLWYIDFDKNYLALPLEDRLSLDWVRYLPMTPIPYERLLSRYGKPDNCDSNPEDFRPQCVWESKGVLINLSDDKKLVTNIDYWFTVKELFPSPAEEPKPSLKKKSPKTKPKKEPASL